jgi:hypothetical protein
MNVDINIDNLLKVFTSKKAWACGAAIAVPFINKWFGLEMDAATLQGIVYPLIAYIVGQGIADVGKQK